MHAAIPENLNAAYKAKTLIPIVGAGVSMALRKKSGARLFPSWKELLERAATKLIAEQKPELANAIRGVLPVGSYQQAADYARQGLVGGLWDQFFKENFQVKKDEIEEADFLLPQTIWKLSDRLITLNYDRVLRFACPSPDDVQELDNTKKGMLADFNRHSIGAPAVWHLHGSMDNLSKIIFTSESYSKLYAAQDQDYQAALETFKALCGTSSLLFVGCGLDDAELLQQLAFQHELFSENTGPHYALVPQRQYSEIKIKLQDLPIELVCFSDFGQPLIDQLNAITVPQTSSMHVPSALDSANLVTKTHDVASPIIVTKRIAVLTANPIGETNNYGSLLAEFKSLRSEVSYFALNIKTLNDLTKFNYIFILSTVVKTKIAIEDIAMQDRRIGLKELEDSIGDTDTEGVFIFLNHENVDALDPVEIASLSLPTMIFPNLDKQKLNSLSFKLFKKSDFTYFENSVVANRNAFKLVELTGKYKPHRIRTPLPDLIDPKTTKNYVGRRVDLENICREIIELRDRNEVLTIKGSGGIGKTITIKKITVALAERNLFKSGIDFIDCEFIQDYTTFEKKIAANFNLEDAIGIRKQIKDNLYKQDKLIILDNVETLLYLDEAPTIKDFIDFICEYATVVATSRELLKLECERVYDLRPFTTDEAYELFKQQIGTRVIDENERTYIRQNIVEELLDNNPLAIKLIAKNIPKGKSFKDLKRELEDDVFRKANDTELAEFDRVGDTNIERRKSLYASINFSYRHLNAAEKMAFELLSLFPDGIDMENLKRIAAERKADLRNPTKKVRSKNSRPIITDVIIKALEDKSMTQVDRHTIKLQSIVGKFAEYQLHQRSAQELGHHYRNATDYNVAIAQYLVDLLKEDRYRTSKVFNFIQGNFFKSVQYLDSTTDDHFDLLNYLENLSELSVATATCSALAQALEKRPALFASDEISRRTYESIICFTKYHAGDFKGSLARIKTLVPLTELRNRKPLPIEGIMCSNAMAIYRMEGEEVFDIEYCTNWESRDPYGGYPSSAFKLGELNSALLEGCTLNSFTLEAAHASGNLEIATLDSYIDSLYEKNHLGLMEAHYLKAKMGVIDKSRVKRLAIVNPYTRGLQQLMLAMTDEDRESKIALFEKALANLEHIRYYYVEALLIYAKFLSGTGEEQRYAAISQQGVELARLHHYRWLQYRFEDIAEAKMTPYSPNDYPLPAKVDMEKFIGFHFRGRRK